jgi:hypothetical protein
MKTSTKTKTARIVIGELPSASNASNPLLVHSAAVVASSVGGLASGGINPFLLDHGMGGGKPIPLCIWQWGGGRQVNHR